MHEEIVQVVTLGPNVLFGGKSRDTFLEHEHAQWVYSVDQAIDAQVKFEIVD